MRKPLHHHLLDYFLPHARNDYRPHFFAPVSIAIIALLLVLAQLAYLADTRVAFFNEDFLASVLPGSLIALTNTDRAATDLGELTENATLNAAATAAAEDMAAKGYFAHVSPEGRTPWDWLADAGYHYSYAGENLAVNFTDSTDVEKAWMASPTHHANIVKPQYTEIGIGIADGVYKGERVTFVVQFFGTPASTAPAPVVAVAEPTEPVVAAVVLPEPASTTAAAPEAPSEVLGTSAAVGAADIVPSKPTFLARIATSPSYALSAFAIALFILVTILLIIAVAARGRLQHKTVILGGLFLLMVLAGTLELVAHSELSVEVPAQSGNAATSSY